MLILFIDRVFIQGRCWSHHSMGFTATSLSIGKHSPIVTLNNILNERESTFIVHFLLFRVCAVNHIEGERSRLLLRFAWVLQINLGKCTVYCDYRLTTLIVLLSIHRSSSHHNFNSFCVFRHFDCEINQIRNQP